MLWPTCGNLHPCTATDGARVRGSRLDRTGLTDPCAGRPIHDQPSQNGLMHTCVENPTDRLSHPRQRTNQNIRPMHDQTPHRVCRPCSTQQLGAIPWLALWMSRISSVALALLRRPPIGQHRRPCLGYAQPQRQNPRGPGCQRC